MSEDDIDREEFRLFLLGERHRALQEYDLALEAGDRQKMAEAKGRARVVTFIAGEYGLDITD